MSDSAAAAASAPLAVLLDSYTELVDSLHIPLLDQQVYESLFVRSLRTYRASLEAGKAPLPPLATLHRDATYGPLLGALQSTLTALRAHERETVHVLRLIEVREEVMMRLIACEEFYQSGKSSLDDAQVTFMVILEELQVRTLQVVEAIETWRARLCRPFPFRLRDASAEGTRGGGGGADYLQCIHDDCAAISGCSLGQLLSLRLEQFPCCSNVDMPRVVRRKQLMRRAKLIRTGAMWQIGLEPAQPESTTMTAPMVPQDGTAAAADGPRSGSAVLWARSRQGASAHADSAKDPRRAKQKRLVEAEAVILHAARAQEKLMASLWQLAHEPTLADTSAATTAQSFFAPLLYLPTVLRYASAAGSSLVAPEAADSTTTTPNTGGRSAPPHAPKVKSRKSKHDAQKAEAQQAACLPLEASAWTNGSWLARDECWNAAMPLSAGGGGTTSPAMATRAVTGAAHASKPPHGRAAHPRSSSSEASNRHHHASSSSSSSSRSASSSLSSSSRTSASRSSSEASSGGHHARAGDAYQPYASSSSASSDASPAARAVAAKPHDTAPSAKRSHSSASSASSEPSAKDSPFVRKASVKDKSDSSSSSSSSSSSDDGNAPHDRNRRLTQEESLEMLRHQLLEERRLSMSPSASQSQTPLTSPTRVVVASVVPPVPQPPQNVSVSASPISVIPTPMVAHETKAAETTGDMYHADEFETASETETESSD